jgi:hypothetical protein
MSFAVITAFLNIIIDPMWCFSHENKLNAKQLAFAEREQKTNYLTYHHEPYNALLIGNSRVVYMDQNDFSGMSVFNYAVSAMVASEYAGYIGYARNVTSNHIKIVYIGLSFASVNDEVPRLLKQNPPAYFVGKATDRLNRLRTMLNPSILEFSWRTLKFNLSGDKKAIMVYNRHNVASTIEADKVSREAHFSKDLSEYRLVYKSMFHYEPGFKANLRSVKEQNPGIRIVVFTTPVSKPMHCLISEAGLIPAYEQWIRDIVQVFGELHHFEYVHSIAENCKDNFIDANHYLPQIGTLMAHRLQGNNAGVPDDFGIIITRDNLEQQLAFLRGNFNACR